VLGSNGVGKSTLNRALSGIVRARAGAINFEGRDVVHDKPQAIVARGLIHVPEGRRVFPNLSVRENLDLGSYRRGAGRRVQNRERVFSIFPRLRERSTQRAGTLSGGEQQMLAIGRALMARPRLVLLDEPSMGLAPQFIRQVFKIIRQVNEQGTTVLLVEQNANQALALADRAYVLETGAITHRGTGDEMLANPAIKEAYLGV
jgi:branched-chain amino acid transport system ATP-binding protein